MRIAVFGASGFIGSHLVAALQARGDDVRAASMREPHAAAAAAGGTDAVVNLAGEPLGQRWTSDVKRRIVESRTVVPHQFLDELARLSSKPAAYISASAVGYYGTSLEETLTEASPPGDDFLAKACVEWERTAKHASDLGMRVACVRTGLALGRDGGALAKLMPIFKTGGGGRIVCGKQWHSWIHIDELIAVYLRAIDGTDGTVNATAPEPVRNSDFVNALAKALHRPAALRVPAFALRLLLGEGADVLLEGQRVIPARLQSEGFRFQYPTLQASFSDLL